MSHSYCRWTVCTPRGVGLAALVIGMWLANRDVCPGCRVSDRVLSLADGTRIRTRLYRPSTEAGRTPAVVVCPGYLANARFMEFPWVADLTRLGIAVLVLDRRGQGRSDGFLWPRTAPPTGLDEMHPDVLAAVEHLRTHEPAIAGDRIALFGHSDGGSAAIAAGCADWNLLATVAVSASVAPWMYVNHVVPRNLLLIYGAEDQFVLADTDKVLVARATRDYLAGDGTRGNLHDATARRLVRIRGAGHLTVLYHPDARREILTWLRDALGGHGAVTLTSPRLPWIALGLGGLVLLLMTGLFPGLPNAAARPDPSWPGVLLPVPIWTGGLFLAPWLHSVLDGWVPAWEGSVFAALLLGPVIVYLMAGAIYTPLRRRLIGAAVHLPRPLLAGSARGCMAAGAVIAGLKLLLWHQYDVVLTTPRLVVLAIIVGLAAPAFVLFHVHLRAAARGDRRTTAAILALTGLATAAASPLLFERMSTVPGYLLGAVLGLTAADQLGARAGETLRGVAFSAVLVGGLAAGLCALH